MGIIVSGIRIIKPAYNFCLQTIEKVDTTELQGILINTVYECFRTLKPLSRILRKVTTTDMGDEIFIGEWIRERWGYQKYGSIIRKPKTFQLMVKYGDKMKPFVRKTIASEFSELVDLTKQLQSYDDLTIELDIPPTDLCEPELDDYECTIINRVITRIGLETKCPNRILLWAGNVVAIERDIDDMVNVPLFEDIISYLVELYKKADDGVRQVREHNEKILAKMEEIVAPLRIAEAFR